MLSTTLYRVVHDAPNAWVLICSNCREKVENRPLYRYGGTWKANKLHQPNSTVCILMDTSQRSELAQPQRLRHQSEIIAGADQTTVSD